jgi:hypothetical protein
VKFNTSREQLAWAAGFFDGEGHIRNQDYGTLRLTVTQVDTRPLARFIMAVKCLGNVIGPYGDSRGKRQPVYMFSASSFEEVQAIVAMLWCFLSAPKREQVVKAFRDRREYLDAKLASGLSQREYGPYLHTKGA